ncbi:MAG: MFS transporter [Pleurocapsa sp. MO_226.B13]|nr:MFS transporter [Pleurocapsa sp. MO_226.B13]
MQPDFTSTKNPICDRQLYIIIGVTLTAIMGGQTIAPILSDLTGIFDVSPKEIELVMTMFFIPVGIATPILGLLADRIGIKKVLVPSLLLFGIAGGCSSFAHDFQTLLGWRFLQGLGAASLDSLALTMIAMLYRGRALGQAMSLNASVIGMSSAVYPLMGGVLGALSWRYPFLVSVTAFPLVMLVLMVLKLPQKPSNIPNEKLRVYLKETLKSVNSPAVLGLLLAVGSLFVIQFGAFITYLPILAGVKFGASGSLNGVILASMSLSLAIVASQLGRLAERISEITLIKAAFVIMAIALGIVPLVQNAWLLLVPSILFGIGQALALPSSQAILAGLAADNRRAAFMAVNASVQSLGQAVGPLMGGIFFSLWGMSGVFWATAGFSLMTLVLFNLLLLSKPEKPKPEPEEVAPKPETATATTVQTSSVATPVSLPEYEFSSKFPTILQLHSVKLIHLQTNETIEIPNTQVLISLGKPMNSLIPDVDLSQFRHSGVVSKRHADIRIERDKYYIQDLGSSNGTYLNKYPLLPGNWYKLNSGDYINFGKGNLLTLRFEMESA